MTALLLTTLFLGAALLAGATLAHGLRGILAETATARAALAACPQTRMVNYRIRELGVRRAPAQVLVLPVKQAARLTLQPQLRAAA